jgi:hypothetical protein
MTALAVAGGVSCVESSGGNIVVANRAFGSTSVIGIQTDTPNTVTVGLNPFKTVFVPQ